MLAGLATALFVTVLLALAYLYLLALAGIRTPRLGEAPLSHRFAVVIPAHNEEATIEQTVHLLRQQTYPADLFTVFVVADNCHDSTAQAAVQAGAVCAERRDPVHHGKGHALAWLLPQVLARRPTYDAVVVFDADTAVDPAFLRVMSAMLAAGCCVIQGKHVIRNPTSGWLAAIMYAAFAVDNRLRNQGRSNLGLSCKLMGDGMCFARSLLEARPWRAASNAAEDAEQWAILALEGVAVRFAPAALAYGEMVTSARAARHQRERWMRGRARVSRRFAARLLSAGLRRRNWMQLDAALELLLPSYSTVLLLALLATVSWALGSAPHPGLSWPGVVALWGMLLAYPLLGLVLEGAPAVVYLSLLWAPAYIIGRTGLRLWVWLRRGPTAWIRTPRSGEAPTAPKSRPR